MRRGRPSRYGDRSTEPQPRFQKGDTAGEFTILEYLGYSKKKPHLAEFIRTARHWYNCRCQCGTTEVHTQQQLIDVRRNRMCANCISQLQEIEREIDN